MTLSLETRDLTIRFGGHVAVNSVSCAFRPGELTAIVGPNGAGKTTYFNLISGQLRPSAGSVLFDGEDITAAVGAAAHPRGPRPRLPADQSVSQPQRRGKCAPRGAGRPAACITTCSAVDDAPRPDRTRRRHSRQRRARQPRGDVAATALSHGDQRKLEVAMMMALEPKVFMFDEPTAGMSVDEVPVVLDLIARLKQDTSKIILLVEHKMDVVRSLADRIIVLHNGQLVADGKPAEVIASPIVQEAYLGIAPGKERGMSDLLTLAGVHTHIGRYHILQGVDFAVPRARPRCCSAATAPARPRRCAPSWACGRPRRGRSCSTASASRQSATPDIARAGIAYVPESMAVFSDLTVQENLVLAARDGPLDDARLRMDLRILPGAEAILAVARRHAVRRTEADAVDRPRHRRAAQAAADRRADQGPGAGDRG